MTVDSNSARIGVWERRPHHNRYERIPGRWDRWADVDGFSRTPDGPRVLVLGESAARGLFYDPFVTLANLVEDCLRKPGHGQVEVIDLARTGARVDHLLETAAAAKDLAPDAVVVFAGNNWKYGLHDRTPAMREAEAESLRRGGVAGLLAHREAALAELAADFVHKMCDLFEGLAPVLFVLPESNLLDWRPQPLVPVLGDGREAAWLRQDRAVAEAAAREDWDGVLDGAEVLSAMDGGASDGVHRHVAAAHLARGDRSAALAAFRRARDVRLWSDVVDPAWLPTVGADAARRTAAARGALVADLAELFPSLTTSGIPDAALFLDSCHLTARGLRAVATEVATRLGPALGLEVTADDCVAATRVPSAAVEGGALFGAALAAADFAQPQDTLNRLAAAAAESDAGLVESMTAYCAAPNCPVPWWMRPGELSDLPNVVRYVRGVGLTGRYRFDQELIEVFEAQVTRMGGDAGPGADRTLPPGIRTELVDAVYAPAWRSADWTGVLGGTDAHRHYFRAHTTSSRFTFGVATPAPALIELTARHAAGGKGTAIVRLNGHDVDRLALHDRWQTTRLRLDASTLLRGRNTLELHWDLDRPASPPLVLLADRLAHAQGEDLCVVFGEVFSIRVTLQPGPTSAG